MPSLPTNVRPFRVALRGSVSAADACLLVRGDERPFALPGAWAGGGALVGSEPVAVARADEDPFELLDRQPDVAHGDPAAVGGGWFGYLGYRLGARLERIPPGPPRPSALPDFALAFYDHLLRLDSHGQWWFEALWSDARDAVLRRRLGLLRDRLERGATQGQVWVGTLAPSPQDTAGHPEAVAACRERIAEGEIFQANICLRLEGRWSGDPLDLFARTTRALAPRHAALVAGPWGALCSASPELFLRRRGRHVLTEPIKGTAPRESGAAEALSRSAKDRAENVMIVDLMRNDLGRVCEYGSVEVPALTELREAPGVWHLVSTVTGTLRPGVGDAELLRACFPPGSVTGAPKIRAMRVIAELEASGREAYTGAIGYASPVAGLELNVAIRTLETSGERIWLGAGGGVVADSDPLGELEECLVKARPVVKAAGGELASVVKRRPLSLPPALTGAADRPDPAAGVLSTMLVRDGAPVDLAAHLGAACAQRGRAIRAAPARLSRSAHLQRGRRLAAGTAPRADLAPKRRRRARRGARRHPARARAGRRAGQARPVRAAGRARRAQMARPPADRRARTPDGGGAAARGLRRRGARGRPREPVDRGGRHARDAAARRAPPARDRARAAAERAAGGPRGARGAALARAARARGRAAADVIGPRRASGRSGELRPSALRDRRPPAGGAARGGAPGGRRDPEPR